MFMIHDMIGCGVTWADIMTNSFMFIHESHWHCVSSVTLNSNELQVENNLNNI